MSKVSGGLRTLKRTGGLHAGDSDYGGLVKNLESIVNIKNHAVYKAVKEAISRYHSVFGVRQTDVKIGDLKPGVSGVHITENGVSKQVILSKSVFNGTKKSIEKIVSGAYNRGHLTKTNKPAAHVVTHELAHATWNEHLNSKKAISAGKQINKLYNKWDADSKKSGYGSYAALNVSEFFAETTTKAIHGKSDKYTKNIKSIIKKYNL